MYPPNMELANKTRGQTVMKYFKKEGEVDEKTYVVGFSQVEITKACVEMIILDELPFSFVEGNGFRYFCLRACPKWKVPCRQTVAKAVLTMYFQEKENLKSELSAYRVCLTTDTWTSIQNVNYMVLTAHYIDGGWVLQKKVLNFCVIPNHKGESIGKLLEECVVDWGLDKILTITVDNASANDSGLREFIRRIRGGNISLLHEGKYLHMRCVAHILNLIVNDGLGKGQACIQSIRNAVRYVRSSPQRLTAFKMCADLEKIVSKGLVVLDVPTRWNSTYLMLKSALKFRKAFNRLLEEDGHYLAYFSSESRIGPPSDGDWEFAVLFADYLKPFYEITLKVCCSNTPTINGTFEDLFTIYALLKEIRSIESPLYYIVEPMKDKYEKYWGELEKVNIYLFVAVVLDPRYKIDRVQDYLEVLYGDDCARALKTKMEIQSFLYDLLDIYTKMADQQRENESASGSVSASESESESGSQISDNSSSKHWFYLCSEEASREDATKKGKEEGGNKQ